MAGNLQVRYPATSTVAITCTLASLASDTNLLIGRESTVVDNTTNVDLDHLVGGIIRLGTSPTVSKEVRVYAHAPWKIVTGTPTYTDLGSGTPLTGADAGATWQSANARDTALRLLWAGLTDAVTGRVMSMPPTSIAQAFGGMLPAFWGLWIVHNSVAALDSTGANHALHYQRIQNQYT